MEATTFFTKSEENLTAARLCFESGLFNAGANRAYYAIFQAAVAILMKRGFALEQSKHIEHTKVQSLFANELIHRKKVLGNRFKTCLPNAQTLRNVADYRAVEIGQRKSRNQLLQAEEFINAIKKEFNHA